MKSPQRQNTIRRKCCWRHSTKSQKKIKKTQENSEKATWRSFFFLSGLAHGVAYAIFFLKPWAIFHIEYFVCDVYFCMIFSYPSDFSLRFFPFTFCCVCRVFFSSFIFTYINFHVSVIFVFISISSAVLSLLPMNDQD